MRRLDDHRLVQLPRPVFDRCKKFGEDMGRHYKAGGSPSLVGGKRGAWGRVQCATTDSR
jgi:hypothetical protein